MLVVDDHPLLTGGLVGTEVLVNTPVTAPSAQNTATATAHRNNRRYRLEEYQPVEGLAARLQNKHRERKTMSQGEEP